MTDLQKKQYDKLINMYENPKSRGFINHIIIAWHNIGKGTYKRLETTDCKCFMCNAKLFSTGQIATVMFDEEKSDKVFKHFTANILKSCEIENDNPIPENPFKEIVEDKKIAVVPYHPFGEPTTTTAICEDCVQPLYEFIVWLLMHGDKTLSVLIKQDIIDAGVNSVYKDKSDAEKTKVKEVLNKKKATYNLEDNKILNDLKNRLTDENKT
jgi:hypothetical protein